MPVRLQKYLASCGLGSRRTCEQLIRDGLVTIDGTKAEAMGLLVDEHSEIRFMGEIVKPVEKHLYIALNKPLCYVSTARDQFGRKTVIDLLATVKDRVFPVGRLDYHSEGLLLLTNDGSFAYKLTHPKHEVPKTYIATVKHPLSDTKLDNLRNGIYLDGIKTFPCNIKQDGTELTITIREGRNRQIRRMFDLVGHQVLSLRRVKIGSLEIGGLKQGEYRFLSDDEVRSLLCGK